MYNNLLFDRQDTISTNNLNVEKSGETPLVLLALLLLKLPLLFTLTKLEVEYGERNNNQIENKPK
jgi:hypothetical protein